jgi:hypothetical protein
MEVFDMNSIRRKQLEDLIPKIEALKTSLENILSDEQDAFDNMPENLQNSTRYEMAAEACDNLCDAVDLLDEAKENVNNKDTLINCIDDIIDHLNAAAT